MTFNIQQYLIDNKIEYRTSGKNVSRGEYSVCCPFCSESKFHCGINPVKQLYHCWICGNKGNYEKLLSKLLGISYIEARHIINPISDLKKALEIRGSKSIEIKEINNIKNFKLPDYTKPFIQDSKNLWQEIAHDFLVDKYNLTWQDIADAKLHYCIGGKYKNSIIIPIYKDSILVNFIGRVWDKNSNKRYLNCSNEESLYNTKCLLYNYDSIKQGQDILIIVEGVFDCIKAGLNRTVALCGLK